MEKARSVDIRPTRPAEMHSTMVNSVHWWLILSLCVCVNTTANNAKVNLTFQVSINRITIKCTFLRVVSNIWQHWRQNVSGRQRRPNQAKWRSDAPPPSRSNVGQFTTSFMCAVSKNEWALAIQAWATNTHIRCYKSTLRHIRLTM